MEITNVLTADEERAVSPVIGVILMVAITVILAAVIGTFVLGLGNQVPATAPNAQITFDQNGTGNGATVTVNHESGDAISVEPIDIRVSDGGGTYIATDSQIQNWASTEVTAGNSVTIADGSGDIDVNGEDPNWGEGTDITVTWTSESGEDSSTLGRYEVT